MKEEKEGPKNSENGKECMPKKKCEMAPWERERVFIRKKRRYMMTWRGDSGDCSADHYVITHEVQITEHRIQFQEKTSFIFKHKDDFVSFWTWKDLPSTRRFMSENWLITLGTEWASCFLHPHTVQDLERQEK